MWYDTPILTQATGGGAFDLAVVAGASLIAGIIQTVTGFGSVVFLMMVLPFYFDMIDAPTLAIVTNQLFCMALCWKYRKYIRWRLALPPTLALRRGQSADTALCKRA